MTTATKADQRADALGTYEEAWALLEKHGDPSIARLALSRNRHFAGHEDEAVAAMVKAMGPTKAREADDAV